MAAAAAKALAGADGAAGLARLMHEVDATSNTDLLRLQTAQFLQALRAANPRFGEMQNGAPVQQDAGECWRQLFTCMKNTLPALDEDGRPLVPVRAMAVTRARHHDAAPPR